MMSISRLLGSIFAVALLGLSLGGPAPAHGQELVYEPINPVFGGSPGNTQFLLNTANNQNPFEGGGGFDRFRDDPLQNFEDRLQRQVLNQLSREVIQDRFGDIDLTQEGSFDFERFSVDVTPGPSGISIRVFNKQTGESTTVEVPRF